MAGMERDRLDELTILTILEDYLTGLRWSDEGRFDAAIESFTRIIDADEDHILFEAYAYRGMAYLAVGFFEDAREDYDKYLRYAPTDTNALNTLGGIYALLGQWGAAKDLFEGALFINPWQSLPHRNLATYYRYRKKGLRYFFKFASHWWQAKRLERVGGRVKSIKMTSGTLQIIMPERGNV